MAVWECEDAQRGGKEHREQYFTHYYGPTNVCVGSDLMDMEAKMRKSGSARFSNASYSSHPVSSALANLFHKLHGVVLLRRRFRNARPRLA